MIDKKVLIKALEQINVLRIGEFTLRSGMRSPVYIDLRPIIAYPKILRAVASALWDSVERLKPSLLCGVPYTALPIATCIALDHDLPMVICRKEVKEYGTKKQVEGIFSRGQSCVVMEDVLTTGSSVLNTIDLLEQAGLQVTDVAVFVDREQGGREALEARSCRVHRVFTLDELTSKNKLYF